MDRIKGWFGSIYSLIYLLCGFFAMMALFIRNTVRDPDLFWHIKTGEYILTNKIIPKTDVFSWWGEGKDLVWVAHEWLADIILYLSYKTINWTGLVLGNTILFFILLALCTYYVDLRLKKYNTELTKEQRGIVLIFSVLFSFLTSIPFTAVRPQIVSFIFLLLVAILLEREKYIWSLPIILFGINFHGGFWPLYMIVLSYYALTKKRYWLILMAPLFSFITPNTYYTFLYPFYGLMDTTMSANISEWQPVTLFVKGGNIVLSLIFLFVILIPKKKIWGWDLFFLVVIGIQSVRSLRFMLLYFILFLPIFFTYIDYQKIFSFFENIGNYGWIKRYESWKEEKLGVKEISQEQFETRFISVVNVFLAAALLMMPIMFHYSVEDFNNQDIISGQPEEALAWIAENPEYGERILNEYAMGGYLLFNDIPSFVDGRSDPFIETFNPEKDILEEYFQTFYKLQKSPKVFLNKYNINNILWVKGTPFGRYMLDSPDSFKIVYEDDTYILVKYLK